MRMTLRFTYFSTFRSYTLIIQNYSSRFHIFKKKNTILCKTFRYDKNRIKFKKVFKTNESFGSFKIHGSVQYPERDFFRRRSFIHPRDRR